MKKENKVIPLSKIVQNTGQIEWLPRNPRKWTPEDVRRTVDSIVEDPDFLEDRPLLVVPQGAKFVAFCGNLRRKAAPDAGLKEAPCVIYYPVTDEDHETVKRRAMKDNGTFGCWDMAEVESGRWGSSSQIEAWGGPAWGNNEQGMTGEPDPAGGLPPELEGKDISPDDLPKISGDDEVAMERVIIVYPREREADMAALMGIDSIDKVVYNISELVPEE